MTRLGQPENRATRARLRELTGPELYRRNAFRLTGLESVAGVDEVDEVRSQVMAESAFGRTVRGRGPLPLAELSRDDLVAAFDILDDPTRRLVDELLWLWGSDHAACGCPSTLHSAHDAAIRAHARALDAELAGVRGKSGSEVDKLWSTAAERWGSVLRRAAFWDHVRSRVGALDDPRLDDSVVGLLRADLPRVLMVPVVELATAPSAPARLRRQLERWDDGSGTLTELITEAAAPLVARTEAALTRAEHELKTSSADAAALLQREVKPTLDQLEPLLPHARHSGTARLRDSAAVLFNNCAMNLADAGSERARELLTHAKAYSTSPDTAATIAANERGLLEQDRMTAELAGLGVRMPAGGPAELVEEVLGWIEVGRYRQSIAMLEVLQRFMPASEAASVRQLINQLTLADATGGRVVLPPVGGSVPSGRRGDVGVTPTRGRPNPPMTNWDAYRLLTLILNPVRAQPPTDAAAPVARWMRQVTGSADRRHLYLLLQVWWLTADPGLKLDIHRVITAMWVTTSAGKRAGKGLRWAANLAAGVAVVALAATWLGGWATWVAAFVVPGVWFGLLLALIRRRMAMVRRWFPDFRT